MNRKSFLRLGSLGIIASLLPIHQIDALNRITKKAPIIFDPTAYQRAVALAVFAKKAFYEKNFAQAEQKYLECIALAPASIRFYDNLQKVYASQNKILLAAQLLKSGLEANPTKIAFYDRLAKMLMRLAIGNKKIAKAYGHSLDTSILLSDAKQLYLRALAIDSKKAYLTIGLEKVNYKQGVSAATTNAKNNVALKAHKKANRAHAQSRYEKFNNQELLKKIEQISAKKRTKLSTQSDIMQYDQAIIKEKKTLYTLLIHRQFTDKNYKLVLDYAKRRYAVDPMDISSIRTLKYIYVKTSQFKKLVDLVKDYDAVKNTICSKLAIIHAIWLGYKKDATGLTIAEAIGLATSLLSNPAITIEQRVNTTVMLNKIYLKQDRFQEAETLMLDLITNYNMKQNKNRIMVANSYISVFVMSNRLEEAQQMLKVALEQKAPNSAFHNQTIIQELTGDIDEYRHKLCFAYKLFWVYKKLGQSGNMNEVLNMILKKFPRDRFALKYKSQNK